MLSDNYFQRLKSINTDVAFAKLALEVFRYQSAGNKIYSAFIQSLRVNADEISNMEDIPFLPIEFFKSHTVICGKDKSEKIFTSSGTTSSDLSKHFVKDITLYENVFTDIFTRFYGSISDYTILALLPSYLEREGSSLVYMMDHLIRNADDESGFFLDDFEKLFRVLEKNQHEKKKTILFGVTYALLDSVAYKKINFPELIVMETGGMKGRRKEMIREEVHAILKYGFGVGTIHSEYGMTELLSQAYSKGNGIFNTPTWMKVLIRDPLDPVKLVENNSTGGINIIDLANIHSCAFIATQDLGKMHNDDSFEVLGRFDFSDVRGCNLMVS